MEFLGKDAEKTLHDSFESVDDPMLSVRVRLRKTVSLELKHLRASVDRKSWTPMNLFFFPPVRLSSVAVKASGPKPDLTVPVAAWIDHATMMRDSRVGIRSR